MRSVRRLMVSAFVLSAIAVISAETACVIAQPTDDVPTLPASRPVIVRTRLDPPTSAVITSWVTTYHLTLELVDPTAELQYAAFIDYDSLNDTGLKVGPRPDVFDSNAPNATTDRTRVIDVSIAAPLDLDRCHVIEIVVALGPYPAQDSRAAHTPPDSPGGDSATWFYAPGGDLTGCPSLDAGIEASVAIGDAESGAQ